MKKYLFIFLLVCFSSMQLFSQSAYEQMKQKVAENDYEAARELIDAAVSENAKNIEVRLLAGDIYVEFRNFEAASLQYMAAVDIDDENWVAVRKAAVTLAEIGKFEEAEELAEDAIEEDEDNIDNRLTLAEVYIKAGNFEDAELTITQARELDRKSAKPYVALGDLYFASKVYALAQSNYEEALSIDENILDARINLAKSYYWLGNREYDEELRSEYYARSLKEWNNVSKMAPENANAYFEQGKILYLAGMYDKAAPALNNYVQLRPSGKLGRWWLAQSLYEIGRCDSAAPHLQQVSQEIDSVKDKSLLLLAQCYLQNESYQKAAVEYQKLYEKGILEIQDERRYAQSVLFAGDTTRSISIYKNVISKDPESEESCKLEKILGQLELQRKNYLAATEFFEMRLKSETCGKEDMAQINYLTGYAYLFAKDSLNSYYDKAVKYLNKSLEMDSTNYLAHIFLGDAYISMDSTDRGLNSYFYVIDKVQDTTDLKNNQAKAQAYQKVSNHYLENKNWNKLAKYSAGWTEFDPENEWAWIYRAFGAQGTQNLEQACTYYGKVLAINPDNDVAKKNYGRYCTE